MSFLPAHLVPLSKFISLVLSHSPQRINLALDDAGWASIDELLQGAARARHVITRGTLMHIVDNCPKRRFAISEDGLRIRANQGHSAPVELGLIAVVPPELLYHGTASSSVDSILRTGLNRGQRQHVHLSANRGTALSIGLLHGPPAILRIHTGRMSAAGHSFFCSANEVWLVDEVPARYIEVVARAQRPTVTPSPLS